MAQPQKISYTYPYLSPQDCKVAEGHRDKNGGHRIKEEGDVGRHEINSAIKGPSKDTPPTTAKIVGVIPKKNPEKVEVKVLPLELGHTRTNLRPPSIKHPRTRSLSPGNYATRAKPKVVVISPDTDSHTIITDFSGFTKQRRYSADDLKMTSSHPKSPKQLTPHKKEEHNESFWDKLGTLGRKKKVKEVQEFQTEGKITIDLPGSPYAVDVPPDDYMLDDNEERSMIQPHSLEDPKLKQLLEILIQWINDELASDRIIVKHMEEDLYDGMVLHKLIEKLTGITLDVPEVTQSEEGQKQKLRVVLNAVNHTLGMGRYGPHKWSVESVHSKNLIPIIHLLVALARHFRAPIRLPENVIVNVVIVQKRDGQLNHRIVEEELTGTYDDLGLRCERDAFDTLFDHAPDKLQVVKKSLITFVNKQLNKVNLDVYDLDSEFHDGVHLCLLMGLLEGYFVPLYHFHLTPKNFDEKLHNVSQSFELMMDAGLAKPKARPEDIVNKDLKSTLRVLYNLFTKYKNLN